MAELKTGVRLKSAACDTQVMVIKGIAGDHVLSCGGAPMVGMEDAASASLDPAFASGTFIGKRYVNQSQDLELLCVKAGAGSLCLDGEMLEQKQAKVLPSSD